MNKLPSVKVGHHPVLGVFIDVFWGCNATTLYQEKAYTESQKAIFGRLLAAVCNRYASLQSISFEITSKYGDNVVSSYCFLYMLDSIKDCVFPDYSDEYSFDDNLALVLQEFPLESVRKIAPKLGVYVGHYRRLAYLEGKTYRPTASKRGSTIVRCGRS